MWLDVPIFNAGIINTKLEANRETRHEEMFQVNYLFTVLLDTLLFPMLKKSKGPSGKPRNLTLVASSMFLIAEFAERNAPALFPAFDDNAG